MLGLVDIVKLLTDAQVDINVDDEVCALVSIFCWHATHKAFKRNFTGDVLYREIAQQSCGRQWPSKRRPYKPLSMRGLMSTVRTR
jgi:hypothetical protein